MPSLEALHPLLITAGLCLLVQFISWLWQWKTNNTDIVDISWTILIVTCALVYFFTAQGEKFHSSIILLVPILWYSRLAWHLISRYQINHEDGRYQALRKHWQANGIAPLQTKLLFFFLFQALLAWFFSYPAYIISNLEQTFSAFDMAAILLLCVSLIGVTVADWQLSQFKKSGHKGVCNVGLWKYSRHPNYFFEWIHWFCYPLIGFSLETHLTIDGLILLLAPFVMLIFLFKLTGIPFNEEQNIRSKGDAYRRYQKTTNMFFLGKPKVLKEAP
ncbi:MAG: DUF1295 domain-containing protein [Gammaproteobacteria bacterium]|nr:DUF1295 domain-containing protein [Gammaproteobacteria bacterium]